jgi:RNA polymerase sigma factor (sigma-70 family)
MTQAEFEKIAPGLRKVMMSVGRSFFGNESDADDVAQEGLVALWRYRDRLDAGSTHEGLAIRIAKHCCMDMVRKRKDTVELNGEILMKEMLVAQSPQEILETEELKFAVEDAVNRLNPSERRLYELRQVEGRELDEIADETKIPKPSVKSIISAARRKIYEELKKSLRS